MTYRKLHKTTTLHVQYHPTVLLVISPLGTDSRLFLVSSVEKATHIHCK